MALFQDPDDLLGGQANGIVPAGQPVQPGPSEQAMANQLYQMQQMILALQQEVADMRRKTVNLTFNVVRDNDGRVVAIDATEGRN